MKQADAAESNEEANRLNQEAVDLKVANSKIDGRLQQLDFQTHNLMEDVKKVGPNLKDIRLKLNKNWIPVWLKKPTDFRPTTKMPNFRLNDHQIQTITAYLWQSALTDTLAQAEARQCRPWQGTSGDARLPGLPFHRRRRPDDGRDVCRESYARRRKGQLRLSGPLDSQRPRAHSSLLSLREKRHRPRRLRQERLPYVFDLQHSRCPNDGHELQVQNMTVMPSLRLSWEDAQDIASYLMTQKRMEPSSYADASYMDDPKLKDEGKKWIRQFGCAGCHEISGMEDEGRIGTDLTVEGSKPIERLDFALFTVPAERGGKNCEPITDPEDLARLPDGPAKAPWYDHKGFFEHKLAEPNVYDKGKIKSDTEASAHAESAPHQGAGAGANHVPSRQRGDFPARQLPVPAR